MCKLYSRLFEHHARLNSRSALRFMDDDQSTGRSMSGPNTSVKGLTPGKVRFRFGMNQCSLIDTFIIAPRRPRRHIRSKCAAPAHAAQNS